MSLLLFGGNKVFHRSHVCQYFMYMESEVTLPGAFWVSEGVCIRPTSVSICVELITSAVPGCCGLLRVTVNKVRHIHVKSVSK